MRTFAVKLLKNKKKRKNESLQVDSSHGHRHDNRGLR